MTRPSLKKGSKGDYVVELQQALIKLGYSVGNAGADGDFGNATLAAVKRFQTDHKLTVDGVVGTKTWAAIDLALTKINQKPQSSTSSNGKMKYSAKNTPLKCMMTQSTCYKGTTTMKPKGVLWHSTGANNPNLKRYVQPDDNASNRTELLQLLGTNTAKNDWNHITRRAGLNCWIGKLANGTVTTVQTMPWNYKPWGCGSGSKGSCNNGWIQFEICEDSLNNKDYFDKVFEEGCQITAYLCQLYNINPKGTVQHNGVTVPTILCHKDSHTLKLGSGHADVYPWFNKYGKTMDDVRNRVAELLKGGTASTASSSSTTVKPAQNTEEKEESKTYKVRVTAGSLNVRQGPSTTYSINGVILRGEVYTIVEEKKDASGQSWGKLKSGLGWINLKYAEKA